MEHVLHDLPQVICYQDDILVTGRNNQEHLETLEQVLQCIEQAGLKLKESKCRFLKNSVEYLGFLIDSHGLHTILTKVEAFSKVPTPSS